MLGNATPDSKNTFISFNYDLVLEEAAKNLGLKVWYGLSPETTHTEEAKRLWASGRDGAVALLKLHGSTNWGRQDKSPNYVVCGDYEELLNARLRPALVPPTWKKVFSSPLEEVWRNAVATLSTATRLAIVGYSMSPTDSHFRYLLAAGLKDNVSLRRIEFVTWGPQPEPEGDDYEDLVLERAKGLVREQLWERGDVHYTYTGTRGFFMQHVNGPDWNRAWGQGLSHFA
ncbi:MAG: SIR2 family protein [Proteobacteria bacterium]|nr:SIR2 family protein [Pseudomonadota bacterium]